MERGIEKTKVEGKEIIQLLEKARKRVFIIEKIGKNRSEITIKIINKEGANELR